MIDVHAHLLPGLDDGPTTMAESVVMARVAAEDGITTMACTPHMHPRWPTTPAQVHEGIAALAAELEGAEVPLQLVPGGEIDLGVYRTMSDDDLRAASLGGAGRWLLLEMPLEGWPLELGEVIADAELRGFGTVLAHPERARSVQQQIDRLRDPVGRGALCQLTADSFTGAHGPRAQRTALALLTSGMCQIIASDAHSASRRPPALREGLIAASDATGISPAALEWTVTEGPLALIEGREVRPPRLSRLR